MNVSVALTPAEIQKLPDVDLRHTTVVVFDVLRATSTFTTALAYGANSILPAFDLADARVLQQTHPDALLGGERNGEKIEGFDLGNSPLEYRALAGRKIISTTTNGTVALRAVAHASIVAAGALLNISALARTISTRTFGHLLLVCAGTGSEFAIEDGLAAGALLQVLSERESPVPDLDDAAQMLLALWKKHSADPFSVLAQSKNGCRLIAAGRVEEVAWCAQLNRLDCVGIYSEGILQVAS